MTPPFTNSPSHFLNVEEVHYNPELLVFDAVEPDLNMTHSVETLQPHNLSIDFVGVHDFVQGRF